MKVFVCQDPADPADYRASPIDFPAACLPPTLLFTPGLDPLRDQGRAYAAKLIEAGVPRIFREAQGNIHGYICLAQGIPRAANDIKGNLAMLKAMLEELRATELRNEGLRIEEVQTSSEEHTSELQSLMRT